MVDLSLNLLDALDRLREVEGSATETEELDDRLDRLERVLDALPGESRSLLLEYYQGEKSVRIQRRKALAGRFGISDNALKIRIHRLREMLQERLKAS